MSISSVVVSESGEVRQSVIIIRCVSTHLLTERRLRGDVTIVETTSSNRGLFFLLLDCCHSGSNVQYSIQTGVQFLITFELTISSVLFQGVCLLPGCFKFIIISRQSSDTIKLTGVIVPVTSNGLDLRPLKLAPSQRSKGLTGVSSWNSGWYCCHDLVKDLLTIAIQEDLAFVLGVLRIFHNINVAVVRQFTFLLTSNVLVRLHTTVPQSVVVDTDGTLVSLRGQAVLNEPTTRTLEGVGVDLCPGHCLPFGSRQEADDGITVAASVKFGAFRVVRRHLISQCWTSPVPSEGIGSCSGTCALDLQMTLDYLGLFRMCWMVGSYVQSSLLTHLPNEVSIAKAGEDVTLCTTLQFVLHRGDFGQEIIKEFTDGLIGIAT